MDLALLDGVWEVVDQGDQNVFERGCFLHISQKLTNGSYGSLQGNITTFYLTVGGAQRHDKIYNWHIRDIENHQPLLDLVFTGELDSDDLWDNNYYYKITKLTDTNMWWQGRANGDNSIIKFRRRTDINFE